MHLTVFVEPANVEVAQAICDGMPHGPLHGAKVSGLYGRAWGLVPKWARMPVDKLDDAGIRNFAIPNVGADQIIAGVSHAG